LEASKTYQIKIVQSKILIIIKDWPSKTLQGTKSIVFTTTTWAGGPNPYLSYFFFGLSGVNFITFFIVIILALICQKPVYEKYRSITDKIPLNFF
jgi:hypothetical protein